MDENKEYINSLLGKYFSSDANEEEKKELIDLLKKHNVNYKEFILLDSLFKREINKQLQPDITEKRDEIWIKLKGEEKQVHEKRLLSIFQRVAAILIIPLLLSFLAYFLFQNKNDITETAYAEIQCPMGVRTAFELPDGTTGFLNGGSKLKYAVNFSESRDVNLIGEGYFNVFHNPRKPFVVHTKNLDIKVMGTEFNVISYVNDISKEIILNNGSVEVYSIVGKRLSVLKPNERFVLDTEKMVYEKSEVEADQYSSWTEGKLVFKNESMEQVAKRLGRWYNVDIIIQDHELLEYVFRATFIDEPLEEILKLMALTAPFMYIENTRENYENIYGRRKIILKLDKKRLKSF